MAKKNKRKSVESSIKTNIKKVETGVIDGVFVYTGPVTIGEFARQTNQNPTQIVSEYFMSGKMYNINHILSEEDLVELCLKYELDFRAEKEVNAANFMDDIEVIDDESELVERSPIVTIMGHVDHGKTTLLDKIRNANVADGESGGITQHTGAYSVEKEGKHITFLDTPGHEAFTAMRSRGANLTDIVILVVAADDGVMPQTKEAIIHANAAGSPIIVFVNKMDKEGSNPERIKSELTSYDVVAEEFGGDVQFVYGSALKGTGIDDLLKSINILSEILELKANPNRMAIGTVVESETSKTQGSVITLVVTNGTLKNRDFIVAGSKYGRVRTILDPATNKLIKEVKPGFPAIITGLKDVPIAGDKLFGFQDEKYAKKLAEEKKDMDKKNELKHRNALQSVDGLKILNIIVKSDVAGTSEAVKYSLNKLESDEAKVNVISASSGEITNSDVLLASASNSVIYTFNLEPNKNILEEAKTKGIEIKNFSIIYKMIEEVEAIILGMETPKYEEKQIGKGNVIATFFYSKVGTIAGVMVEEGKVIENAIVKVFRNSKEFKTSKIDSLKRESNKTKLVTAGKDCGMHIAGFDEVKVGDWLEFYEEVRIN
ncbi:MAG: translation initiation factor IF-2 [Mollicutes bacterium PWAP]|nr:translation initiation factor IF-2 [Mollicutes bacterium PWAP]